MDVFAHGLWAYAIYFKTRYRVQAALFAVLPDIVSFGFFLIVGLFTGTLRIGRPNNIPDYVLIGYNFTHSLVIFFLVFGVIYFITREIYWPIGGWLLHILIDIPTHTREFFPTPFLWPLSDFKIDAISWSNIYFIIINYSLLVIVYLYLIGSSRIFHK